MLALLLGAVLNDSFGDVLPSLAALIFCRLFLALFVRWQRPNEDLEWLGALCQLALLVRVLCAVVLYYGPWDKYMFAEDQAGYDWVPTRLAHYWEGSGIPPMELSTEWYRSRRAFVDMVAIEYYVFGHSFVVPRIFNCLAGALLMLYSYYLATNVFGRTEGRVTAVWTCFFPSMILWASLNMRDIWLALSVMVVVRHAMFLRDRFSFGSIFVVILHLVFVQYTRAYLVLILAAALCVTLFLARTRQLARDLVVGSVLLGVLLVLRHAFGFGQEGIELLDLDRLAAQREVLARTDVGASGYLGKVDLSSPGLVAVFAPLATIYFLFSPFPWEMTVMRRIIILPEMIVWYWCIRYVVAAIRDTFRNRAGRPLALLLPTGLITLALALGTSNAGLAYRYRVQVIGLFLAFAAAGYVRRKAPWLANQQ